MKRERATLTKKDVGTIKAEDVVEEEPAPAPVESKPSAYVKVDDKVTDELTKRAEGEFKAQLAKQLETLNGQTCSPDDTLRVKVAFEVTLEPRELTE